VSNVQTLFDWGDRQLIGQGAYADVFAVACRTTHQEFAVKQVFKSRLKREQDVRRLQTEIHVTRELEHKGCTKCYHVFQDEDAVYFQLELLRGGDLCQVLMQHTTLPEHAVARFTRQVLETLEYLQNWYGIAHLDIKLDNLLCSSTNVSTADIKLADFGFAQILRESANTVPESNSADDADVACGATLDQCLVSPKGTMGYMSPELFRQRLQDLTQPLVTPRPDVQKMDVYSVGVVAYLLLSGAFPHKVSLPRPQHLRSIHGGPKFCLPTWRTISHAAQDFCRHLLHADPTHRPSIRQALDHEWLCVPARSLTGAAAPAASELPNETTPAPETPPTVISSEPGSKLSSSHPSNAAALGNTTVDSSAA
jgi:serine/threonine protein kinase